MPSVNDIKHKIREESLKALAVVQDTELTQAEKKPIVDGHETEIKKWQEKLAEEDYLNEKRKAFTTGAEITPDPSELQPPAKGKSIGAQLINSTEYKGVNNGAPRGQFTTGTVELKANLTELSGSGGLLVQPDVQPGLLPILFQKLTVADLIPNGTTSSNLVRYLKEATTTNAAAPVAESGLKPTSAITFTNVDEPVRKIANIMKVSDEMFEDEEQLQSYVNQRLSLFVQIAEEAQLISGDGIAPDLVGLLNRSGLTAVQPKGADSGPDALYKEITKIRIASFLDPTAVVVHPTDWQNDFRLAKDANGQYYAGGPFTGAYGNGLTQIDSVWGLPVVTTLAATQGTALVGAFATAAQIFRRNSLTVEMTNANEDDFKNNLIAIRAEERLALAVYRPSAFGTVSGL